MVDLHINVPCFAKMLIMFTLSKATHPNKLHKEVNCTEPSPSVFLQIAVGFNDTQHEDIQSNDTHTHTYRERAYSPHSA
jgi:hypothetical protein